MSVQRRLLLDYGAHKEVLRLDTPVRAKLASLMVKFQEGDNQSGVNFERLRSRHKLYSARVDRNHRAIIMHIEEQTYLLLSVLSHDAAYDRIDERLSVRITARTGGIEVVDVDTALAAVGGSPAPADSTVPGLFDHITDAEFAELDVEGPVMSTIRVIRDRADLDAVLETLGHTYLGDVLDALALGASLAEVTDLVTKPVMAVETVDIEDFGAALERPATRVVSSDLVVAQMLEAGPLGWRLFLHPSQQQLVERDFDGPARVSGGPGCGKTVVALHRAARLARRLPANEKILLTTYGATLSAELSGKLAQLLAGDEELMSRVEVLNIDKVVWERAAAAGVDRQCRSDDNTIRILWNKVVEHFGETQFSADFLHNEWKEVICGQLLASRDEYFAARRHGRVRKLGRAQRARIWELTEHYLKQAEQRNVHTWDQLRMTVALLAETEAGSKKPRYRHVIVDEAQDMTYAHWRLLRALVPCGVNDMFITGDTFQRVHAKAVALAPLGIEIRGRSSKLSLSYRVTTQNLATAMRIMGDHHADDLDEGDETLSGFRSVLSGPNASMIPVTDESAEVRAVVEQVRRWTAETPRETIAVCAPTNAKTTQFAEALRDADIPATVIGASVPDNDVVHVSTMHRLKGLEYRRVIIAGVGDGFPSPKIRELAARDMQVYERAMAQCRNLLFVAATRARDMLAIVWCGEPSPLLEEAVT